MYQSLEYAKQCSVSQEHSAVYHKWQQALINYAITSKNIFYFLIEFCSMTYKYKMQSNIIWENSVRSRLVFSLNHWPLEWILTFSNAMNNTCVWMNNNQPDYHKSWSTDNCNVRKGYVCKRPEGETLYRCSHISVDIVQLYSENQCPALLIQYMYVTL